MSRSFRNLALLNFSENNARQQMMSALESIRKEFGKTYSLGSGAETTTGNSVLKSISPADPQLILGSVESANVAQAKAALQRLKDGSRTWSKTSPKERISLVNKLADWLEQRRYELSAWMVYEVGKNWREADADVCEAVDFCRYYALEMERLSNGRVTQVVAGEDCRLFYFPKGVCVVIAPWNFPLAILAGMTVAALVTGNTVLIKPAEQSSIIAALFAQGLDAVGFPKDAFYFLPGEGEVVGPALVADEKTDMIVFTGSAQVGLSIIETASRPPSGNQRGIKKVVAELGGKNALIIDEDADIDEAILGSVHSAFGFQGQKCSALSRLLVHERIYDSFVKRFLEAASSLRVGSPLMPEFQVGPVVDAEAQNRIKRTISDGKTRMKVLYEHASVPENGYYVKPIVFECTDRSESLFQNEIFGPVVLIKKVKDLDEAIADTNSVRYALTGGIYSRSPSHIERVKQELEVGNLYINRSITGALVERHPFGGFKLSGIGSKAGGPDYLLQFVEPRTIVENTVRRGFASA